MAAAALAAAHPVSIMVESMAAMASKAALALKSWQLAAL
jgi:hypothetical protein